MSWIEQLGMVKDKGQSKENWRRRESDDKERQMRIYC
jgi:hypothetical protein